MKKLILCLFIISLPLQAEVVQTPDPCLGDVACQYKALAEKEKKEKQAQEEKVQDYRNEMLDVQQAQLEETQKQNELIEESIEVNQTPRLNDAQMEQEDTIEYRNDEVESLDSEEPLK